MLARVEIPDPAIMDYPHQLQWGMRQRVMIAEALLLKPKLLLADRLRPGPGCLVKPGDGYHGATDRKKWHSHSTHNLGLLAETAKRVAVMYRLESCRGKYVDDIFYEPRHPYTKGLLLSLPGRANRNEKVSASDGNVPSLYSLPSGCSFHPGYPETVQACPNIEPPRFEIVRAFRLLLAIFGRFC